MSIDNTHMSRALELANSQHGRTGVNPSVGCVIVDSNGLVISEAATGDGGRPHAEQTALRGLSDAATIGGTAYVTLEPCRERSTGEAACSQLMSTAGLARIVIATLDPHPKGRGGLERLREAGIQIETGLMQAEADSLYADFFASVL